MGPGLDMALPRAAQGRKRQTPTGLQSRARLSRRRALMATLNLGTLAALLTAVAVVLGSDGWDIIDAGLFLCVALSAPWTILGFWNAAAGLWLRRGASAGLEQVSPHWTDTDESTPVASKVAVLMALRNEDPDRAYQRMAAIRASLDASGQGAQFDLFILSDSDDPEISAREAALFAANRPALDGLGEATYRRRLDNSGFKAGNIRDFLNRWGDDYTLMVPLDADSIMSGGAIVTLCRIIERHPRLGILQSLAVGAPATSPFARLFQFGMRHGMRSFTMGSAWWQGDCGPYWGHNAAIRVAPFKRYCELPVLSGKPPLGGEILSHDQVEAVLMRRAGFEVRVTPLEGESWEENPVSIVDFMTREQRWCNGNMQYWPLLRMSRLLPTSRFQLFQAIMMYLGSPAWMLMTALAAMAAFRIDATMFNAALAIGLFATMFAMSLAPKIAGAIDIALEPGGMRRYGGTGRFFGSVALETVFGMLMAPAVAFRLTLFMIGLLLGRRIGWGSQIRDAYDLGWTDAARALWPQTLFGMLLTAALTLSAPHALPWAAPVLAGLVFAIPFAVLTTSQRLGLWMARRGIAAIPEEIERPAMLDAVANMQLEEPAKPDDGGDGGPLHITPLVGRAA